MSQPTPPQGLSQQEAAAQLARDGRNELAPARRRTPWHIALEVVREPMLQLLLAAGLIYLVLGDRGEALMLLAFVALTMGITIAQEQRTERALEALRDLTSPRALVLRDGQPLRIPGREVVLGDLLLLNEGDRVPADALLLSANDLQADESLLTGESMAVSKQASPETATASDTETTHHVYAGTMLVRGQGLARVSAVGAQSEIGRIGQSLGEVQSPDTPLHQQTRRLVRIFSVLGLSLSAVVVAIYGFWREDWLGGLLAGITLAMSMLPQEFLLILTVFLAMGAWRLSRQQVLARRSATIETLGAATVLCTDKTGTLTQNRMTIAELAVLQGDAVQTWTVGSGELSPGQQVLLEFGLLASERDPIDPMEKAFVALGKERLNEAQRHAGWTLVHEYGLSPQLMAMTHVWQANAADQVTVAVKGAPEAVLSLCRLSAPQAQQVMASAQDMASRGLRVLGVARAQARMGPWPATPHGFDFEWLGLVALVDPLREGVPQAVLECRSAGIRVVMITGDHPATACAIAAQAGLHLERPAMLGQELQALSDEALGRAVADTNVFARVQPQQKLRIVEALKTQGQVVAMMGDGVNDAPSLKAAHIGIAMGGRGTDVAREASALVLLDDDFSSVVAAIRQGRRIYDNLRKAMAFVLAVHVPIAGLSLLPLLFGLPLVFTPVHIAFLELLIDPVCSIVFEAEPEEDDVMQRPPRDPAAPLFSRELIGSSLLQGVLVLAGVGGFFVVLLQMGQAPELARAAAFTALVLSSMAIVISNRSLSGGLMTALTRTNPTLWRTLGVTVVLLAAALWWPALRELFRFGVLTPVLLSAAVALATLLLGGLMGLQSWRHRAASRLQSKEP